MSSVFISYHRGDRSLVERLAEKISILEGDVWYDQELKTGQDWWNQILEEIRKCDAFVFALTTSSLKSEACKREHDYANALGKPIIPLQYEPDIEEHLTKDLARIHFINYTGDNENADFQLARALSEIEPQPLADPLPEPPGIPYTYIVEMRDRISSKEELSREVQEQLVKELRPRATSSDEEESEKAIKLLRALCDREDTLHIVAVEIERITGEEITVSRYSSKTLEAWLLTLVVIEVLGVLVIAMLSWSATGIEPWPRYLDWSWTALVALAVAVGFVSLMRDNHSGIRFGLVTAAIYLLLSGHVITPYLDFAYALYAVTVLGMAIIVIFKEPSGRKVLLRSVPWLIGYGLHLAAGCGLYYANADSRRKWLYPLLFFLAIALLIAFWALKRTPDEIIGILILVAAGLAALGFLFGFVEVSLAIRRRKRPSE